MTGCAACSIAKVNPRTTRFDAGCLECSARALAGDPRFHSSSLTGALSVEYIAALRSVFGEEWRESHERVKDFAGKLKAQRTT